MLTSTAALVVVVALGALARLLQYLAGSSLSGDESFLALNLVSRSYGELFDQLDYNQVAPQLLLVVEKLGIDAFGRSEWAVRLVPFLAGLAALALFRRSRDVLLPPVAVLPAVALVAFSDPLVAWTATNKQYAVDVLATVVVLLATARLRRSRRRACRRRWPRGTRRLSSSGSRSLRRSFSPGPASASSSGSFASAVACPSSRSVQSGWHGPPASLSHTPRSRAAWRRCRTRSREDPAGFSGTTAGTPTGSRSRASSATSRGVPVLGVGDRDYAELVVVLALAFAAVGVVAVLRGSAFHATILLVPLAAALVAAAVGAYPLLPRAALWSLPILALLVARGMVAGFGYAGRARLVVVALAVVVLGFTIAPTAGHAIDPRRTQEMAPLLAQLARETTASDRVFVYYKSQYGARWYLACDCVDEEVRRARDDGRLPLRPLRGSPDQWAAALGSVPPRFVVGQHDESSTDDLERETLRRLAPDARTWVVISNEPDERRAELLATLDERGTRLRTIGGDGDEGVARAYLYDLSRPPS